MLNAYFLFRSGDVGISQSTGFYGLTDRYMCRSYTKTSFEALLTTPLSVELIPRLWHVYQTPVNTGYWRVYPLTATVKPLINVKIVADFHTRSVQNQYI